MLQNLIGKPRARFVGRRKHLLGRGTLCSTAGNPTIERLFIMAQPIGFFFAFLFLLGYFVYLASAQVTFSKGWGPGKRAALYDNDCVVNSRTLTLTFHTLMAELKHLMACDHQAALNYLQSDDH